MAEWGAPKDLTMVGNDEWWKSITNCRILLRLKKTFDVQEIKTHDDVGAYRNIRRRKKAIPITPRWYWQILPNAMETTRCTDKYNAENEVRNPKLWTILKICHHWRYLPSIAACKRYGLTAPSASLNSNLPPSGILPFISWWRIGSCMMMVFTFLSIPNRNSSSQDIENDMDPNYVLQSRNRSGFIQNFMLLEA